MPATLLSVVMRSSKEQDTVEEIISRVVAVKMRIEMDRGRDW